MLDPGVLIDERHEIQHRLGHGGMAEVFQARDTTTGRAVAIKVLRTVDPQSMTRFRGEIEVLSRLDHPGVVRLLDTGSHDGAPYLLLDLVNGPSLAHVLERGPLGIERSISLGQQLADALTYAHGLDVVHRDLKPANVLFDAELTRVRLADFGIARFADTTRITAVGLCIGTAAYIAPEQLQGQVGPAADIYALGLVVLECLTGALCYPGTATESTMARLHHSPHIPANFPPWLRHTLRAMTARDPRCRPAAKAVGDAFRRRSVDSVLASTAEIDAAALPDRAALRTSPHQITGPSTTIEPDQTETPSWEARAGRRRLLLAFGSGALTSAAALTAIALALTIGPLRGNEVQAAEPQAPPTPTPTTIQALPTSPPTTQAVAAPAPTTPPAPPSDAAVHDPHQDEEDGNGHGKDRGRGHGKGNGGGRGRGDGHED